MLFYGSTLPTCTLDDAAVLREEYRRLRDLVLRVCPSGEYRRQAVQVLEESLMAALWAVRLTGGGQW